MIVFRTCILMIQFDCYSTIDLGPDDVNVFDVCNEPCNCTTESYDPICGEDKIEYFSPCFAGCLAENGDDVSAPVICH